MYETVFHGEAIDPGMVLEYLLSLAHFVYLDVKPCERITYSLCFA